jgi:formylglycine-generating enzyme required for sulfatase activity
MYLRKLCLLILSLLLVCSTVHAKDQLMVNNLKPLMGVNPQTSEALSSVVRSALGKHYDVQSLSTLAAISGAVAAKMQLGCDEEQCLMEVAGAMDIGLMVSGDISKFGKLYTLNMQLISTQGTTLGVIRRASEKCRCSEEELVGLAERVALKLINKKPGSVSQAALPQVAPNPAKLYVEAKPLGARVRILNINPKFEQGIELEAGKYNVEVSAAGYELQRSWETLAEGETKRLTVLLVKAVTVSRAPFTSTTSNSPVATTSQQTATSPKARFTNTIGQEFAYIKPGTFMMGTPKNEKGKRRDETLHQVTITKGFYMQTTEVTQGQWKAVMGSNPSKFHKGGDNSPVEMVSWEDCQGFINKLNQQGNKTKYRLPTEAQWEYAARAGTTGSFAGSSLDTLGWYSSNSDDRTHPVAQKQANDWGLYDMHGNVWEWVQDWSGRYSTGSITDPTGPSTGKARVYRGGSWRFDARYCRLAHRGRGAPADFARANVGFRVVADQ